MESIQRRLGMRVKELRSKKGWSQEDLAEITGFHRTYVGAVERGEKNLTISTLHVIAKTFHSTIAELFRGIG